MTTSSKTQARHDDETESAPKAGHRSALGRYSRHLLIFAGLIVLSVGLARYYVRPTATLGSRVVKLEVVNTSGARERGLSGRDNLPEDRAMLFEFDTPGKYCFWMKGMRFAIDMIWLDEQKRVVKIQKNVEPATYPASFCPQEPAQYVVEVASGVADKAGLKEGDQVRTRSSLVL